MHTSRLIPETRSDIIVIQAPLTKTKQSLKSEINGKIQGDGRKFLDRFNSYFWSQILLQSLN